MVIAQLSPLGLLTQTQDMSQQTVTSHDVFVSYVLVATCQ